MGIFMVTDPDGFIISGVHPMESIYRIHGVMVHFDGSIVDLAQGLNLNVITMDMVQTLSLQIRIKILSYVLRKVVGIFSLYMKGGVTIKGIIIKMV